MFASTAPATGGEPSGFLENGYELVPPPQGPGVHSATVVGAMFTLDEDELNGVDDPPPGGGNPCPDEPQSTNSATFRLTLWRDRNAGGPHGHLRGRVDWLSVMPPFDQQEAWKVTRFEVKALTRVFIVKQMHSALRSIARAFAPPTWGYVAAQGARDLDEQIEPLGVVPAGTQMHVTIDFPGGAGETSHVNGKRSVTYAWCRKVGDRWIWERQQVWRWSFAV